MTSCGWDWARSVARLTGQLKYHELARPVEARSYNSMFRPELAARWRLIPYPRSAPSESPISRTVQWPIGLGTPARVLDASGASAKPQPCPIVERVTGPDNAPGTVVVVGGGVVGLVLCVVVVTGSVVVDVEVGTVTVVGELRRGQHR